MSGGRVTDAMLARPRTHDAGVTVAELRALFRSDHVHVGLLVRDGRLVGVLDRGDLEGADDAAPALRYAALEGRTVGADEDVEELRRRMVADGVRRLAVVDDAGMLLGLLCLKRSGRGFCSDADVADRASERHCAGD